MRLRDALLPLLIAASCGDDSALQPAGHVLDGDTAKPMPAVGFGTCCRPSAKGAPLITSTKEYLQQGGRLIDTAEMYRNHRDLAKAVQGSGVPRDQIWITSKVNTKGRTSTRAGALAAVERTTKELGTAYVDLMLIHGVWTLTEHQTVDVWRGLMDAKAKGLARHIGVSNMDVSRLEKLVAETGVKPAALQLEYHPWVGEDAHAAVAYCQRQGIAVTAYGSLGGSRNKAQGDSLATLATERGVAPAALLLRWATNRGVAVIPGATSAEHIRANLHLPAVSLSDADLTRIGASTTRPPNFAAWKNLPNEVVQGKKKKTRRGI